MSYWRVIDHLILQLVVSLIFTTEFSANWKFGIVAKDLSKKYKLDYKETTIKAKGAGPEHIDANLSKNNRINLGKWQWKNCIIALIDLSPINTAFEAVNLAAVDGIIGADVLKNGSAVIDYDKNYLYMK